jgi:Zn-dependent peptidase ImmA (M78 family)
MPRVNPEILVWARTTAGLDREEAARRINLNAARGVAGPERLALIEAGEVEPSEALLNRMAKQYRRPLLTFYLAEPPRPDDVGQDFRTLPERTDPTNAFLAALLRDVKARQSLTKELLEDDEDAAPNRFVGSRHIREGADRVAHAISRDLEFDRRTFRTSRTVEDAFNYLRGQTEEAGVFVLLAGSLGSWQTAIDVSAFRGFAIADDLAPVVVVNDQDAKSAWSFTLLHELTHLWLGQSGISGSSSELAIERFCNEVAALILVPRPEVLAINLPHNARMDELQHIIGEFADERKVSRSMVTYQLFRTDRIDHQQWEELTAAFHDQWLRIRAAHRQAGREAEGGPNWYIVRRHRIGNAFLDLARRGVEAGNLTPTRAAKILGVKPMAVYNLLFAPARPRAA